jgi:hypothetical protein
MCLAILIIIVLKDTGDVDIRQITVTASIDTNVLFTSTDNYGNFQFATNTSGAVKLFPRNRFSISIMGTR